LDRILRAYERERSTKLALEILTKALRSRPAQGDAAKAVVVRTSEGTFRLPSVDGGYHVWIEDAAMSQQEKEIK